MRGPINSSVRKGPGVFSSNALYPVPLSDAREKRLMDFLQKL
jgi:hypothetical protein